MSHAVPNTHATIEAPGARGRKKAWKLDKGVSNREDVKKKLFFASNAKKRIVILTFQNIIINWKRSIDDFGRTAPMDCVT